MQVLNPNPSGMQCRSVILPSAKENVELYTLLPCAHTKRHRSQKAEEIHGTYSMHPFTKHRLQETLSQNAPQHRGPQAPLCKPHTKHGTLEF